MKEVALAALLQIATAMQPGTWQQVPDSAVPLLDHAQYEALMERRGGESFWGRSGSSSVLEAWNSAAYDAQGHDWYVLGGGAADYGGNEVYRFDFDTLTWQRLTDPAPLTRPAGKKSALPDSGPPAVHTFDGLTWNATTGTLWLAEGDSRFATKEKLTDLPARLWEFDPRSRRWTEHAVPGENDYPALVPVDDAGTMLLVDHQRKPEARLIGPDGRVRPLTVGGDYAKGNIWGAPTTAWDPMRDTLYEMRDAGIWAAKLSEPMLFTQKIIELPEALSLTADPGEMGFAFHPPSGRFYLWGGGREVWVWNPEDRSFTQLWNPASEQAPRSGGDANGRIYDKWVWIDAAGVFAGLADPSGIWLYKPDTGPQAPMPARIGAVTVDPPLSDSLGLRVALETGDHDADATIETAWRRSGEDRWHPGLPLQRVRPELIGSESPESHGLPAVEPGFAGMIFGLEPATRYDVRLRLAEPDGGRPWEKIVSATTRRIPGPTTETGLTVSSTGDLADALEDAGPGTIITLAPGTYRDVPEIKASGSAEKPLVIRAQQPGTAIIEGGEKAALVVRGDHVRLDGLALRKAPWGLYAQGTTGLVATRLHVSQVERGLDLRGGSRDAVIAGNVLEGPVAFPAHDRSVWDYEGIVVTGQGIEVAHNTVSGFGDALGLHKQTAIPNVMVSFHHNLVPWSGDDGVEMDFTTRNVVSHHNLFANANNGISFQPVWGGPAYAFRNVVLNVAGRPFKMNNGPTGFLIANNTVVKDGIAVQQSSGSATQFRLVNGLYVGNDDRTLHFGTKVALAEFDHNAWSPNGRFQVPGIAREASVRAKSFVGWSTSGRYGAGDVLVKAAPFEDYRFGAAPHETLRPVDGIDLVPAADSAAVDGGVELPTITDGFTGKAPDMGARERGTPRPVYGAEGYGT